MQKVRVAKRIKKSDGETKEALREEAYLIVMAGPRFGETLRLREGENIVGSDAHADIYFPGHSLERRHFLVSNNGEVLLKAEKGNTFLNNVEVSQMPLRDGDLIRAGGILLQYLQEGSEQSFFVGPHLYRWKGKDRRRFPRFALQATADVFLVDQGVSFKELVVKDAGRGGIAIFSKENVPPGAEVQVSVYIHHQGRRLVGKLVPGTVVASTPWKDSSFLLGILFNEPISSDHQSDLYQYWMEMEKSEQAPPGGRSAVRENQDPVMSDPNRIRDEQRSGRR